MVNLTQVMDVLGRREIAVFKTIEDMVPHLRILIYMYREASRAIASEAMVNPQAVKLHLLHHSPFDNLRALVAYQSKWSRIAAAAADDLHRKMPWLRREAQMCADHRLQLNTVRDQFKDIVCPSLGLRKGSRLPSLRFRPTRDHSRCLHGTSLQRKQECENLGISRRLAWCGRWLDTSKGMSVAARRNHLIGSDSGKTIGMSGLARPRKTSRMSKLSYRYCFSSSEQESSCIDETRVPGKELTDVEWLIKSIRSQRTCEDSSEASNGDGFA